MTAVGAPMGGTSTMTAVGAPRGASTMTAVGAPMPGGGTSTMTAVGAPMGGGGSKFLLLLRYLAIIVSYIFLGSTMTPVGGGAPSAPTGGAGAAPGATSAYFAPK